MGALVSGSEAMTTRRFLESLTVVDGMSAREGAWYQVSPSVHHLTSGREISSAFESLQAYKATKYDEPPSGISIRSDVTMSVE